MKLPAANGGVSKRILFYGVRFRHHAGSLLAILIKVFGEAESKSAGGG